MDTDTTTKTKTKPAQQSVLLLAILGGLSMVCLLVLVIVGIRDTSVILPFVGFIALVINTIAALTQVRD